MEWNVRPHRRKFLCDRASVVDRSGESLQETDVVLWGEWEPLSRVVTRWPRSGQLPRALHQPFWQAPLPGLRQNTDPWVFGDSFLYSNCKQLLAKGPAGRRPSALQRLSIGSLILFGSVQGGHFVMTRSSSSARRSAHTRWATRTFGSATRSRRARSDRWPPARQTSPSLPSPSTGAPLRATRSMTCSASYRASRQRWGGSHDLRSLSMGLTLVAVRPSQVPVDPSRSRRSRTLGKVW